jgi:hypothetical protein
MFPVRWTPKDLQLVLPASSFAQITPRRAITPDIHVHHDCNLLILTQIIAKSSHAWKFRL